MDQEGERVALPLMPGWKVGPFQGPCYCLSLGPFVEAFMDPSVPSFWSPGCSSQSPPRPGLQVVGLHQEQLVDERSNDGWGQSQWSARGQRGPCWRVLGLGKQPFLGAFRATSARLPDAPRSVLPQRCRTPSLMGRLRLCPQEASAWGKDRTQALLPNGQSLFS